jgi:hypothetical protein
MRLALTGILLLVVTTTDAVALTAEEQLAVDTTRLADFTLALALVTALLFVVAIVQAFFFWRQLGLMRESMDHAATASEAAAVGVKATQESADATKDVVESFIVKERARLLATAEHEMTRGTPGDNGVIEWRVRIKVEFLNYGGTAARVGKTRLKVLSDAAEIPADISLQDAEVSVAYYQMPILPNTRGGDFRISHTLLMTRQEFDATLDSAPNSPVLFLVGSVTFKDIFEEVRTFTFAMKLKRSGFVPSGGERFNREHGAEEFDPVAPFDD